MEATVVERALDRDPGAARRSAAIIRTEGKALCKICCWQSAPCAAAGRSS
nr:hypothetical protein [Actinoplanes polyasparticus]